MGMIRRPWWTEATGQIWPGCRGYTPTLSKDVLGFLRWKIVLFDSIVSPLLYWGIRTHTYPRVSTPCWPRLCDFWLSVRNHITFYIVKLSYKYATGFNGLNIQKAKWLHFITFERRDKGVLVIKILKNLSFARNF